MLRDAQKLPCERARVCTAVRSPEVLNGSRKYTGASALRGLTYSGGRPILSQTLSHAKEHPQRSLPSNVALLSDTIMAPKRQSSRYQLGIQHSSVGESAASRWKRLAPAWYNAGQDEEVQAEPTEVTTAPAQRGSRKFLKPSAADTQQTITRYDEPTVRHARHGTTTDAVASLKAKGVAVLVDDLYKDRYSAAATLSNASLLKTWR